MLVCSAGCSLFASHKAPPVPPTPPPAPQQAAPVTRLPKRLHSRRTRPAHVSARKSTQPHLNLRQPPPAPLVTLENSDGAKADAQRLLEQASVRLAQINAADLAGSSASTYQQANDLVNAAQQAMAEGDYLAASSLAEKASALTSHLPIQPSR